MTSTPLTDQQLDEYEALANNATLLGADIASPGVLGVLVAEVRRLRTELAAAHKQAIHWAAETTDAKLAAEPDHNRASALYDLLLQLRGKLPCTCARSGGLHERCCRKYVPGHELISPINALAAYRRERAAEETHVVADDSLDLLHVDPTPDTDTTSCHWTDCPLDEGHDNPHPTA